MTAMYQSYFGLTEAPFSIAPNPRYLFMSQRHQEALAHLLYGVNGDGGFVLLTGEVGTGKTTVCRCLLEQIPETCDVAYIFNPRLTVAELLSTICSEFGIEYPDGKLSIKIFVDLINNYLLDAHARGRHTVLIIDEAQNLSAKVLEQMRLLTNLETNQRKLLQIILLGQPELATMLDQPELRQLAQRIVARYHLGPLSKAEVATYVRHRLEVSGAQRQLFPASLMGRLFRLSGGVPRIINVLCDRALLGAYVQGKERVDRATLSQAAREVFNPSSTKQSHKTLLMLAVLTILIAGGLTVMATFTAYQQTQSNTKALPSSPPPPLSQKKTPVTPAIALGKMEWPASEPREQSRAKAYAALFREWGIAYQEGDACQQAAGQGLSCRQGRAGLDDLRQMNHPVVMPMHDAQEGEFYVTLTALTDKTATFVVGTDTRQIALEELAEKWSGHYTLLWRMPAVEYKNFRPGNHGPDVAWLDSTLARIQGGSTGSGSDPVFDDAMKRRLREFQLAQGLLPDGAIGFQTLLRLSSAADQSAPKLIRGQGVK